VRRQSSERGGIYTPSHTTSPPSLTYTYILHQSPPGVATEREKGSAERRGYMPQLGHCHSTPAAATRQITCHAAARLPPYQRVRERKQAERQREEQ